MRVDLSIDANMPHEYILAERLWLDAYARIAVLDEHALVLTQWVTDDVAAATREVSAHPAARGGGVA